VCDPPGTPTGLLGQVSRSCWPARRADAQQRQAKFPRCLRAKVQKQFQIWKPPFARRHHAQANPPDFQWPTEPYQERRPMRQPNQSGKPPASACLSWDPRRRLDFETSRASMRKVQQHSNCFQKLHTCHAVPPCSFRTMSQPYRLWAADSGDRFACRSACKPFVLDRDRSDV